MTTFHLNQLPKNKRIQMIGEFYDIIDSLKDRNEVRFFFRSLLSPDEIANLMRRVEIAVLLVGKYKYEDIISMLGVGRGKISSVHKSLLADENGYKIIVQRLIENRKKRLKEERKRQKEAVNSENPLSVIKKFRKGSSVLPDLLDAVIEKFEDDKELEKEAFLCTPSASVFKKSNKI